MLVKPKQETGTVSGLHSALMIENPATGVETEGVTVQSQEFQGWDSSSRMPLGFSCLFVPESLACTPLSPSLSLSWLPDDGSCPRPVFLLQAGGRGKGHMLSLNEVLLFDMGRETRNLHLLVVGIGIL